MAFSSSPKWAKAGKGGAKSGFHVMLKYFEMNKGFSLLYKTNRFHVAVRLFSNRSQKTSKCGKNISDTLGYATFLFLPHFDVICDLLLNRCMATWNLFVKHVMSLLSVKTNCLPVQCRNKNKHQPQKCLISNFT